MGAHLAESMPLEELVVRWWLIALLWSCVVDISRTCLFIVLVWQVRSDW